MSYDPREYWPRRLRKSGKTYVAFGNKSEAFDKQSQVFWDVMSSHIPGGGRILDFGCGIGRFSSALSKIVDQYEGVDLNEGALDLAPEIENASFTYLKEDRLPFADDYFDGAVALTVLQHIVDPSSFINWTQELARVVKQGGYFFVIDDPQFKNGSRIKDAIHMCRRTPEVLSNSMSSYLEVTGNLSAESRDSHYFFLARRR